MPLVNFISLKELDQDYEKIGKLILKTLKNKNLNPYTCPGVIVAGHGPFTWGSEKNSAVINAEILEFIAQTTFQSFLLKVKKRLPKYISRKHYLRKHGKKAYYGQK